MLVFLNSADRDEVRSVVEECLIGGLTLNPSLLCAVGRPDMTALVTELLALVDGPLFVQVTSVDSGQMTVDGQRLAGISSRVVIKVPCTDEGFKRAAASAEKEST